MKMIVNKNYSIRKNKDYTLLINICNNEEIYLLENSSKIIIDNIGKNKGEIINTIIKKYNVKRSIAEYDYENFINILAKNKILELKDE